MFTDVASGPVADPGNGQGVAWGDYDNDGLLDLYLVNADRANKLFHNEGGGVFTDATTGPLGDTGQGSGVAWGDYDNDGDLDLYLANRSGSSSKLFRNNGGGNFEDVTSGPLGGPGDVVGASWGDYDNDGDLDLVLSGNGCGTTLLRNDGGGAFTDQAAAPLCDSGFGTQAAWGDYDGTGSLDLYAAKYGVPNKLFRNVVGQASNWLQVRLVGTNSNRAGIGARIKVFADNKWQTQEVSGGSGLCQNSLVAQFGLGSTTSIDSLIVRWPSGIRQVVTPPPSVRTVVTVTETGFADIGVALPGVNYSSAAWGDYDQDGDLDILLTGWGGDSLDSFSRVYRNDNGTFVDSNAGLPACNGGAAAWGDYDNDGDLDILLVGDTGSELIARIYRNDTVDGFQYVATDLPGVRDAAVAWGDYDNDGDLDILLTGSTLLTSISRVYRNDRAGHFVEIDAGLTGVSNSAVAWGDYDNDGDLDILMTGSGLSGDIAAIYRNDAGSFVPDVDASAPLAAVHGGTVAWGDYNSDGRLDILLTGYCDGVNVSRVYRNDGPGFTDIGAQLAGVWAGAAAWGDYDNDGDLDILLSGMTSPGTAVVTKVYRNDTPIPNTPPESPQNIEIQEFADSLRFSWSPATDAQTPAAGLTYNLRAGTTPGWCDIVPPLASAASGYRHVVQMGNAQQDTSWVITYPAGSSSVYWSVQAVDGAFAGSAFAEESALLKAGACCWPDGWCGVEIPTDCPEEAVWQGAGTSCDPNPCPGFFVVRPDGTGDYATIQEAIDAAGTGSIIELTNGTFTGEGNRDLNYLGKAITVRSQSGNPDSCIISCESDQRFAHRGVTFESGEDSTSLLSGITITGGLDRSAGGAISIYDSSPRIHNCVLSGNSAGVDGQGGGAIALWRAHPVVSGCVFSSNSAGMGGAVYNDEQSAPSFIGCTFFANSGDFLASAVWNSWSSTLTMENCIIAFGSSMPIFCQILLDKGKRAEPVLSCTNIYGHPDGDWAECLAGQETLRNNLSADPLFCSTDLGDLGLMAESPCAPANSPACGLVGARPVGCTPRPDLLVESIAPDSAQAGQELSLTVTIRNRGTGPAGPSKTPEILT